MRTTKNPIRIAIEKALLESNKTQTGLAEYMGMSPQCLNSRLRIGKWAYEDLLKIAEYTDSSLIFRFEHK